MTFRITRFLFLLAASWAVMTFTHEAASVPFITAGVMIAVAYSCATVIGRIFAAMNVSDNSAGWFGFAMDWFLLLAYLFFIKRNWDILSSVPPTDTSSDSNVARNDMTA